MSLTIKTTLTPEDAASFIAVSILNQLKLNKRVLFFATGGSSIVVGVKVAELLKNQSHQNLTRNLTITLTDERYGPINHSDSNWHQLMEKGFGLRDAKLVPILTGEDRVSATKKFDTALNQEFMVAEYKIGLFGIGKDGHTAGILPGSGAATCQDLAYSYKTEKFERITITPKAIEKLDEAVVWAQGKDKWSTLQSLEKDIDVIKQPAQILKKVPLLTIFTDYKKI